MTTKGTCPDCLRPRPYKGWHENDDYYCSATGTVNDCQPRLIARLRAELASARELSEAEREVVEATMAWQEYDDTHKLGDPGRSMTTFVRFCDAVTALRAKKAGE